MLSGRIIFFLVNERFYGSVEHPEYFIGKGDG